MVILIRRGPSAQDKMSDEGEAREVSLTRDACMGTRHRQGGFLAHRTINNRLLSSFVIEM